MPQAAGGLLSAEQTSLKDADCCTDSSPYPTTPPFGNWGEIFREIPIIFHCTHTTTCGRLRLPRTLTRWQGNLSFCHFKSIYPRSDWVHTTHQSPYCKSDFPREVASMWLAVCNEIPTLPSQITHKPLTVSARCPSRTSLAVLNSISRP